MSENYLEKQLGEIYEYIPLMDTINTEVSEVNVAWHLDHTLKVVNKIYRALELSHPENYKSNFNLMRSFVFMTGKIPRGKAKSPQAVLPPSEINKEDLFTQFDSAKVFVEKIDELPPNSYFEHPVFNLLNRDQAKRFIEIHTNHHLAIVRDILEKEKIQ
ncbi:hypothetical protein [Sediminitomix flava]|nr:hypothetical protein [Sediminitomix flava]